MDVYQAFFSLKPGVKDLDFVSDLTRMMDHLVESKKIEGWRLLRSKLGLTPTKAFGGEFQLLIETRNMAQLDAAFAVAAKRSGEMEVMHFGVNSKIKDITFALYREFPDQIREIGEELF
ncbi:MAG: DUF6614 family protein [Pseudomonadota bacterium]